MVRCYGAASSVGGGRRNEAYAGLLSRAAKRAGGKAGGDGGKASPTKAAKACLHPSIF